ncbi:MAG: glycosyltransferase family 39 protein, partial [Thermomicrobiales bacterium]
SSDAPTLVPSLDSPSLDVAAPKRRSGSLARSLRHRLHPAWIAAGAIAALSVLLGFINLGRIGTANAYYAAAVKSMTESWHAFFFVSFDKEGFVSVDKPPLGLWLQAISARLLGFHGWSIMLPQILAAAISTVLVFLIVSRVFGKPAGLIGALVLAIAPINVATSRNNTSDTVLAMVMILAVGATVIATERQSIRWFVLATALVGVGFNIKMMEAYLVLPALILGWLIAPSPRREASHATDADDAEAVPAPPSHDHNHDHNQYPWRTRLLGLVAGGIATIVVSFSWATVVQLTPASARPYIGSSTDNNIFNLIFEYNGISRLLGRGQTLSTLASGNSSFAAGGGVGGVSENGQPGIFRFLNENLGGQIGWLAVVAVIGLVVAWGWGAWRTMTPQRVSLAIWGGWFLTAATFFSIAGFYHRYYLTTVSPSIAALVGIGSIALWNAWRRGGWRIVLLPATLLTGAAAQWWILRPYDDWSRRLTPVIVGLAVAVAIVLLVLPLVRRESWSVSRRHAIGKVAATIGLAALLIAPATWSAITVTAANANGTLPLAGPATGAMNGMGGGTFIGFDRADRSRTARSNDGRDARGSDGTTAGALPSGTPVAGAGFTAPSSGDLPAGQDDEATLPPTGTAGAAMPGVGTGRESGTSLDKTTLDYLIANKGNARWLVVVPSANAGSSIILETGQPVMALGGFSGSDQILTLDQFKQLVANGEIRFVMTGGGIGGGGSRDGGNGEILDWASGTCSPVTIDGSTVTGLYDCQGAT